MVKIYYSDVTNFQSTKIDTSDFCPSRLEYINSINDSIRKFSSIAVWKLLLYALSKENIDKTLLNFKTNNKRWEIDGNTLNLLNSPIYFSLTHSNNVVAVAISDNVCGIDVELCSDKLISARNRIIKTANKAEIDGLDKVKKIDILSKYWTEYECKLKSGLTNFSTFFADIIDKTSKKYKLCAISSNENYKLNEIDFYKIIQ